MRRIAALLTVVLALSVSPALAGESQRGGGYSAAVQKAVSRLDYHALLIGINAYGHGIPRLETSVNDARAVREELVSRYGFPAKNVVELIDGQATRANILRTLRELSISLDDTDALVVYYAGHGVEDPATGVGYWIPTDAQPNAYETYISNNDVRAYLRAIKAKHVFLVSDSCFSGTMLAERAMPGEIDERFYAQKAASRSRVVLTSGGKEPVLDAGGAGHSIFGHFFLKALRENDQPYLIPTQIFAVVGPLVGNNAPQTPQWGALRDAMDEGGEIVLVNRLFQPPPAPPPVQPDVVAAPKTEKPAVAADTPKAEQPAPKGQTPEKPTKKPGRQHRVLGWTLTGVGGGLLLGGGYAYWASDDRYNSFKNAGSVEQAKRDRTTGQLDEIIGLTCGLAGAASLGVGIYFLASDGGSSSAAWKDGVFLSVGAVGQRQSAVLGVLW